MFCLKLFLLTVSYIITVKSQSDVNWNLLEMEMGMDMSEMEDMSPEEIVHMVMEEHPLPEPNVTYTMDNGDHLCMNENVTYLSMDWEFSGCNVDFDMNGTTVLNTSYIEIINNDDILSLFYIDQILMEHLYIMDYMDAHMHNCTMTPVMKIVDIVYFDDLNIIRLYFIEPQMTEYMNLLDTNMTHKNLYDLNNIYYMEPLDKLQTELLNNNVTNSTVTLNELVCYEYNENGDIIGEVDASICNSDIITEMGSKYGSNGFIDANSTNNIIRRRLLFGWVKKVVTKVVNVVKEVVEKVIDFVETVIDIVTGDIDERFTLGRLQVSHNTNFELKGELKERETSNGKGTLNGNGEFTIEAGCNFDLHTYIDFMAEYELFSFNPSFDKMRIAIITELLLDAYLNLNINGELNLEYELFKLGKRKIFFIGPIPVIVNLFADLTALVDINIDISLSLNAGLERIFFEYGAEYIKGNGWNKIDNSNLNLIPYYNIGSTLNDNENNDISENSCFSITFTPALELRFGIVLYELITIYNSYVFNNEISLQYPYICNKDDKCNGSPSLGFTMDTYLDINIGIEVGNDKYGLDTFGIEYNIITININEYENCINTFISALYYPCCGYPDTLFPTNSPTLKPTFKPTLPTTYPTPAPTGLTAGCKNIKAWYFGHYLSAYGSCENNDCSGTIIQRITAHSSRPSSRDGRFILTNAYHNVYYIYSDRSYKPGYWQATSDGKLNTESPNRLSWERFEILKSNYCDSCYTIRSTYWNKLLIAKPQSQYYENIWADSTNYLSWEQFEIHDC